jgi:hypothetical protein
MLTAFGFDTDKTFPYFLGETRKRQRAGVQPINLRAVTERGSWEIEPRQTARIVLDGQELRARPNASIYVRPTDLANSMPEPLARLRWKNLCEGHTSFLEVHNEIDINRPMSGIYNGSKLLHEIVLQINSGHSRAWPRYSRIGFKVDADGRHWCLEANPMPGYGGYGVRLDGEITKAAIEVLEGT